MGCTPALVLAFLLVLLHGLSPLFFSFVCGLIFYQVASVRRVASQASHVPQRYLPVALSTAARPRFALFHLIIFPDCTSTAAVLQLLAAASVAGVPQKNCHPRAHSFCSGNKADIFCGIDGAACVMGALGQDTNVHCECVCVHFTAVLV